MFAKRCLESGYHWPYPTVDSCLPRSQILHCQVRVINEEVTVDLSNSRSLVIKKNLWAFSFTPAEICACASVQCDLSKTTCIWVFSKILGLISLSNSWSAGHYRVFSLFLVLSSCALWMTGSSIVRTLASPNFTIVRVRRKNFPFQLSCFPQALFFYATSSLMSVRTSRSKFSIYDATHLVGFNW